MRFFSKTLDKLKGALKKTAAVLNTDVRTLFIPGRQINDAFLDELEEKFLQADIGIMNVERILAAVRDLQQFEYERIATPPRPSRRYVYFPLHYEPEKTSNPDGGEYHDERGTDPARDHPG